jgi:2-methylisocitrate lyase-like PEP mutase family enzyme
MTNQIAKAQQFRSLHRSDDPVILYNVWDAGSAAAVARGGTKAIATGSWAVAAAQGYADGEELPLDDALVIAARIVKCVQLPVTVDFEGGYAPDPATIMKNVHRLLQLGVVGLNFEDQVVSGPGLYSVEDQVTRLRAVRRAADDLGIPAFINARTDVFLKAPPDANHDHLLDEALVRGRAYAEAGVDGFFVPGLADEELIREICDGIKLPVNVMVSGNLQEVRAVAKLGVARISFGPAPYLNAVAHLEHEARTYRALT